MYQRQRTYKLPTHLALPDKVVFGLTARQLLLLLLGCSIGYNLWHQLGLLSLVHAAHGANGIQRVHNVHGAHRAHGVIATYALVGQVMRIVIALLPVGATLALAFVHLADRPLEVWLFVLVRYCNRPKWHVWRSVRTECDSQPHPELPSAGKQTEQRSICENTCTKNRSIQKG